MTGNPALLERNWTSCSNHCPEDAARQADAAPGHRMRPAAVSVMGWFNAARRLEK
jgi:hypothetical protein